MAPPPIRIGLVGLGKIARDQHLPALAANADFELVAVANRGPVDCPLPTFGSIEAMLAQGPAVDAVALCMPPQSRYETAAAAIGAGKHVLMEKPPTASVAAAEELARLAQAAGVTLFATWHARHAPGVAAAQAWLAGHAAAKVEIVWKEDVRRWHPGQTWIWQAGGFGVFDPGINALSIATYLLPRPMILRAAELSFPANCDAPVAASLSLTAGPDAVVTADFDFLQTGPQTWDIRITAATGETLLLSEGGAVVTLGDGEPQRPEGEEYPSIYRRFAQLVRAGQSDVDLSPLVVVADAFLLGRRTTVEPFVE